MILVDFQLDELCRQHQLVSPFDPDRINPHSIDLTLGNDFKNRGSSIVAYWKDDLPYIALPKEDFIADRLLLNPGDFLLGVTAEWITLPDRPLNLTCPPEQQNMLHDKMFHIPACAATLCLKSTPAREALNHSLAGLVDAGWKGQLTLELHSLAPIEINAGDPYCQLMVYPTLATPRKSYKQTGRYVGEYAEGAVDARKEKDDRM